MATRDEDGILKSKRWQKCQSWNARRILSLTTIISLVWSEFGACVHPTKYIVSWQYKAHGVGWGWLIHPAIFSNIQFSMKKWCWILGLEGVGWFYPLPLHSINIQEPCPIRDNILCITRYCGNFYPCPQIKFISLTASIS